MASTGGAAAVSGGGPPPPRSPPRRPSAPRPSVASTADPLLASTLAAEAALLALYPAGTPHTRRAIPIDGGGGGVGASGVSPPTTLHVISVGPLTAPPLLLLHGWGAGAAVFAPALPRLAAHFRVHAVDWLGCGASSRPPHPPAVVVAPPGGVAVPPVAGAAGDGVGDDGPNTGGPGVSWFLSALDGMLPALEAAEGGWSQWGGRFHVVGHSLGGYLAGMYALRAWPGGQARSSASSRVVSLTLVSPVGLPPAPPRIHPPADAPLTKRLLFGVVFWLWAGGWTPQGVLRLLPVGVGHRLVAHMVGGRVRGGGQVSAAPDVGAVATGDGGGGGGGGGGDDGRSSAGQAGVAALVDYIYHMSVREGSGEAALTSVLGVGAWAQVPLGRLFIRRCMAIGACSDRPPVGVDLTRMVGPTAGTSMWERRGVTFVYGARDWMDRSGGEAVVKATHQGRVVVVPDAGHHVYWDNVSGFVDAVLAGTGMVDGVGG
ncbi:hypothetical protein MMPV_004709 [Pyropia vietnamensis]